MFSNRVCIVDSCILESTFASKKTKQYARCNNSFMTEVPIIPISPTCRANQWTVFYIILRDLCHERVKTLCSISLKNGSEESVTNVLERLFSDLLFNAFKKSYD